MQKPSVLQAMQGKEKKQKKNQDSNRRARRARQSGPAQRTCCGRSKASGKEQTLAAEGAKGPQGDRRVRPRDEVRPPGKAGET